MHEFALLFLVAGAAAVAGVARRLNLSSPLLLVIAGLAVSVIPGVRDSYHLNPELILYLVLPPLLFAASWQSSFVNLRQNKRAIGLLSVGLVLFTTVLVALVAHATIPGLGLASAFVLGAMVAPPDAVAATSIGRSLGLPRRLVVVMAGESLLNDATALTAYRVAVAAAVGGTFSLLHGVGEFLLAAVGGVVVGYLLGRAVQEVISRLRDPLLENALVLLMPFVVYAVAEQVHASGVLAVVLAGLYLGHQAPKRLSYATRLQGEAVWRMLDFLLESAVFALIGLQLTAVLDRLGGRSPAELARYGAVVLATVIVARFVWIYPAAYLPRRLRRVRDREPALPWTFPTVLGWAGMRGVVSLAAAFGLGPGFPNYDLLVFLTFVVVVGTLVVQGLTLPALIRRLGVVGQESGRDTLAEAGAQQAAASAALRRLDALVGADGADGEVPAEVVHRLREKAEVRQLAAWERLGSQDAGPGYTETPMASYRRLRREMLEAERVVFVGMRDSGRIDDEVLRRVQQELDLEEAGLARD